MPIFTIETTYRLPVFRHRSYEAETIADACRLAIEDDDWSHEMHDYESAGETYVTGLWQGRDVAIAHRHCRCRLIIARRCSAGPNTSRSCLVL